MILTGKEISKQIKNEKIIINPFSTSQINPNSYDLRLSDNIAVYQQEKLDVKKENKVNEIHIPLDGMILTPGKIYLGCSHEIIGSNFYVPIIRAKSSIARLGLFVHITADLIDIGYFGKVTFQLNPILPIRVYKNMLIAQITFWKVQGEIILYDGKYQNSEGPQGSRIHEDYIN